MARKDACGRRLISSYCPLPTARSISDLRYTRPLLSRKITRLMPDNTTSTSDALAAVLRSRIQGEVRFDPGSRALYATDASNYRQVPIGVVLPRNNDDVLAAISACREFGAPLLCRGGGTSLAGQCCNVAVVLDFSKYMRSILTLDPAIRLASVEPGIVLDRVREAAELLGL